MKEIRLSNSLLIALVDDEDYEEISRFRWRYSLGYAIRNRRVGEPGTSRYVHMHRQIGKPSAGMEMDHINRNRLDNRRENLRIVSRKQNARNLSRFRVNTSGTPGVAWHGQIHRWRAYITVDYKQVHLGTFLNKEDAVEARLRAECQINERLGLTA